MPHLPLAGGDRRSHAVGSGRSTDRVDLLALDSGLTAISGRRSRSPVESSRSRAELRRSFANGAAVTASGEAATALAVELVVEFVPTVMRASR
jgi:hypothetical protein